MGTDLCLCLPSRLIPMIKNQLCLMLVRNYIVFVPEDIWSIDSTMKIFLWPTDLRIGWKFIVWITSRQLGWISHAVRSIIIWHLRMAIGDDVSNRKIGER